MRRLKRPMLLMKNFLLFPPIYGTYEKHPASKRHLTRKERDRMKKLVSLILILCLFAFPTLAEEEVSGLAIPNPWTETTYEGIFDTLGLSFTCPEEIENAVFRMLADEGLAEMQFTLNETDYIFRIQPTDEFTDITGMHFEWTDEAEALVGWCEAVVKTFVSETESARILLWYDAAPGIMYSLSCVNNAEADLLTVAQSIYLPVQGECEGDLPAEAATPVEVIG